MLLAFAGIALLLESVSAFRASQITLMAYYVPAVAGLTVLTGLNGQISLGHGALMAVGAYTTALLLEHVPGLPFLGVLVAAVLVTSLVGVLVGAAASRLHGPYLAGATLALAVGLPGVALYFEEELGGEQGLLVSPPRPSETIESVAFFLTGSEITTGKYLGYVGWALALVVLLLLSNLVRSRYGRVWRAVRDDEVAAELAGIDLGRARVLAFVVSAACAGVGGCLLAITTRLAAPTSFTLVLSISLLVAIVIGGLGSLLGAVLGSTLLVFLAPAVDQPGAGQRAVRRAGRQRRPAGVRPGPDHRHAARTAGRGGHDPRPGARRAGQPAQPGGGRGAGLTRRRHITVGQRKSTRRAAEHPDG